MMNILWGFFIPIEQMEWSSTIFLVCAEDSGTGTFHKSFHNRGLPGGRVHGQLHLAEELGVTFLLYLVLQVTPLTFKPKL